MKEKYFFRRITSNYSLFLSILFLFSIECKSQIYYNFESGNLSEWQQSTEGHWEVSTINPIDGKYSLHHAYDNPNAGTDQISFVYSQVPDVNDTIQWSFRIRYGYNPSAANNWAVFLAADQLSKTMFPGTSISGICIGVNYTGSDDLLKIWKVENGLATVVLQTTFNWESNVYDSAAWVSIKRLPSENWEIKVAVDGITEQAKLFGSGLISFFPNTSYFGIYYKYSSSQDQKLWLDDIKIEASFVTDTEPPIVDTCVILSKLQVEIDFSEPIFSGSIVKDNFKLVKSSNSIDSAVLVSSSKVRLFLNQAIKDDSTIWIDISGVQDMKGNKIYPITIGIVNNVVHPFDVIISEIMADPEPAVGLPPFEYLELYNRSDKYLNINKWRLYVRNYYFVLPNFIIPPHNFLILCNCFGDSSFKKLGLSTMCWGNDYLLTNTGTDLILKDSLLSPISSISYSDDWYGDSFKKDGGWSLEMIDTDNPCGGKENWSPSIDKSGGTPGRQNSVHAINPDILNPEFLYALVPSNNSIILKFSEPLHPSWLENTNFLLNNGLGNPVKSYLKEGDLSSIIIKFAKQLDSNKLYQLHIKKIICDCVGNQINNELDIPIALPQVPDSFELVINEVLYNPYPYGSRFVEIYNRSNKAIDASSLIIATIDTLTQTIKSYTCVGDSGLLLFPGNFLAVTNNISNLEKFYQLKNKSTVIENTALPILPDKHGIITLKSKNYQTIDQFEYSDKMQFSLLGNYEGVSLERLNANWPTRDFSNWHSASQIAGFATPGYANSEAIVEMKTSDEVSISPEVFTPGNYGYDDVVILSIVPENTNCSGIINIYSSSGVCVRHLLSKTYLSSRNAFTWDGIGDDKLLQPSGIYIFYVMLTYGNGKVKEFERVCVLGFR